MFCADHDPYLSRFMQTTSSNQAASCLSDIVKGPLTSLTIGDNPASIAPMHDRQVLRCGHDESG